MHTNVSILRSLWIYRLHNARTGYVLYRALVPPLCSADHNGVVINSSWKSSARHNCENHSKGRIVWNYNQADWDRAMLQIESFDWSSLLSEDVNEAWSRWCK
jgi:hypothetical protein